MPEDRQEFSFTAGNFGDVSTEDLIEAGENFLNASPDEVIPVDKKKESPKKEEEGDDDGKKKGDKKESGEIKEVVVLKKEVKEDDIYSLLDYKANEDLDDETPLEKKPPKVAGQDSSIKENEESEDTVFTTIAKELVNLGVFSEEQDEEGNPVDVTIDTAEAFAERFQVETRKQAADVIDRFLERFGDDYKDMFENVFVRGVPPSEYLSRFSKIENINGLDLKDEGNQERIVRELYKSEGRSPEYIDKRITQLKNYSDLADEATEAQRILAEREATGIQKAAESKQQELVLKQRQRNEYLNNVNRIIQDKVKTREFDGIPVDKKFADQTFGYITEERYQTPDKQLLTEFDKDILDLNRPENHPLKVKVAMLIQLAKEDPQLTKLAKKAVAKETNSLFQGLKKTANKTTSNKKEEPETSSSTSWF